MILGCLKDGFKLRKILMTIKHWLGWILRPRHSYMRLREMRWIKTAGPIRDDLPLDNLPKLELVLAETEDQLKEVVGIALMGDDSGLNAYVEADAVKKLVGSGDLIRTGQLLSAGFVLSLSGSGWKSSNN